jgi:hypothetical protein
MPVQPKIDEALASRAVAILQSEDVGPRIS